LNISSNKYFLSTSKLYFQMSPSRFFTGFHSNVDTVIVDDDMEEVYIEDAASSNEFDSIIGAIEDVVIDDEFQDLQKNLLKIYNHHFEVCCAFPKN